MSVTGIGIGSYAYRWAIGIGDRRPPVPMSASAFLDHAAGNGVSLVQYADNLPLHDLPDEEIEALAEKARAHGIAVELGMAGADADLVRRYITIARPFDARVLRIALTAEECRATDETLIRKLRALLPDCAEAGVSIALENHFHLPSRRLKAIVERIDHPNLGVCLDVANSIVCQEWPSETVKVLAPIANNLHLKDYTIVVDPNGVGCRVVGTPLGSGLLDIAKVFAELARAGRSVNAILEHWLPFQTNFEETLRLEETWLRQSLAAARSYLASHNAVRPN